MAVVKTCISPRVPHPYERGLRTRKARRRRSRDGAARLLDLASGRCARRLGCVEPLELLQNARRLRRAAQAEEPFELSILRISSGRGVGRVIRKTRRLRNWGRLSWHGAPS